MRSSARSRWTAARERHVRSRAELPLEALKMSRGEPVIETAYLDEHGQLDNPYAPEGDER